MKYDALKNQINCNKHGISLQMAETFDFSSAYTKEDARFNYGEIRYISIGYVGERLHVLVWTFRNGIIRPISLRKANTREQRLYYERNN